MLQKVVSCLHSTHCLIMDTKLSKVNKKSTKEDFEKLLLLLLLCQSVFLLDYLFAPKLH